MKRIIYYSSGLLILFLVILLPVLNCLYGKNIKTDGTPQDIYIPTGSSYEQVIDSLKSKSIIRNNRMFEWFAGMKHYPDLVKSGRYMIEEDMSYIDLINMLRSGDQRPVRVTFNKIRTINQLAGRVSNQIEPDSLQILDFFSDSKNFRSEGFTNEDIISLFIPNTYEFYWNTDVQGFYDRMVREYNTFWDGERQSRADDLNLTRKEVSILASIIDDEVVKTEEKPVIAGVYLNRLRKGVPLQACPTIKYALNDFTITRVLSKYLETDSPYNTYKYKGFPPGPIGCPSIEGIDAVLNAEEHDYMYFAAKADFSGYHNFSRTLSEHNRYAAEYQRELDRRGIYR